MSSPSSTVDREAASGSGKRPAGTHRKACKKSAVGKRERRSESTSSDDSVKVADSKRERRSLDDSSVAAERAADEQPSSTTSDSPISRRDFKAQCSSGSSGKALSVAGGSGTGRKQQLAGPSSGDSKISAGGKRKERSPSASSDDSSISGDGDDDDDDDDDEEGSSGSSSGETVLSTDFYETESVTGECCKCSKDIKEGNGRKYTACGHQMCTPCFNWYNVYFEDLVDRVVDGRTVFDLPVCPGCVTEEQVENLEPHVTCCICQDYFRDPVQFNCEHHLCRECYRAYRRQIRQEHPERPVVPEERLRSCPICDQPIKVYELDWALGLLADQISKQLDGLFSRRCVVAKRSRWHEYSKSRSEYSEDSD